MLGRYEAYMDDIALSSIDPSILVLNVEHTTPEMNIISANLANRHGAFITRKKTNSVGVTITFEIHEYDTVKRQAICQKVAKWADGVILKTSDRPGQRLRAMCRQYPVVNARDWTAAVTVGFTANALPFWEEENPVNVSFTGTSGSSSVYVPGNADEALVEVSVTANAASAGFTVVVGSTQITITDTIAKDAVVKIEYDDKLIQSIKKGTTSLLNKRTGADDLLAKSGEFNTFSYSADANVTVVFTVRGCWR